MAVAIRIEMESRVDYILSTLGYEGRVNADGIQLEGRFAYAAMEKRRVEKLYIAGGGLLRVGEREIRTRGSFKGNVVAILRKATGENHNGFVVDGLLPKDSALAGHTVIIEDGEGSTKGFRVHRAKIIGNRTALYVDGDPALELHEGYVKQLHFPNWGVPGGLSSKVTGRAVWP